MMSSNRNRKFKNTKGWDSSDSDSDSNSNRRARARTPATTVVVRVVCICSCSLFTRYDRRVSIASTGSHIIDTRHHHTIRIGTITIFGFHDTVIIVTIIIPQQPQHYPAKKKKDHPRRRRRFRRACYGWTR